LHAINEGNVFLVLVDDLVADRQGDYICYRLGK